ncbi:MAG TPA: PAS domain S-box protein [Polyangiaceae bacterium]|nr:PAS domain S-box protein [Polyangiaceae bacterium]
MKTAPDFRRLFEASPGCYLVLSPDLNIVAVSDPYLSATMTKREAIVGRPLFEVFPDNPDDPSADGVAKLRASLDRVLAHRVPDRMEIQKFDIRRPESDGGAFEERYWSPLNLPVAGSDGGVEYIIHCVEDVTDLVRLKEHGTKQDQAIQQLVVRSERRFAQLLDTAPDAIVVVGENGRIELVNARAEVLFGYVRSELVGQELDVLVPERLRTRHSLHVARFLANPMMRPMGSGLELFGRRKDGAEVPIEVSLSPLRSESGLTVSAAIRDITERKRTEAAAKLSAERLASAVESMQDAFALFDANDELVLCNSVYRRLVGEGVEGAILGLSYERLLDTWLKHAVCPEGENRELREQCLSGRREQSRTVDIRVQDGRSLRITSRPTAEGGVVEVIWDLTEDEKRAEELRAARKEAEAASSAKSEFLSSMSHELRTPMNSILGFAQLLQRDKKDPLSSRHKDRVEQILKGGEHLLRLIDDILDLSRIEAGRVSISTEPVSLVDVLGEVRRTMEPMAARQGIVFEASAVPADLPMAAVDRVRLIQILMNFGSNAIKYNRTGGRVVFGVSLPDAKHVRVTVEDSGLGIPLDKQAKLFQPFQRAGQEAGPIQGTGIGLVITKRLAELMGGGVGFRSSPGEGSVFWVDIPVHDELRVNPLPERALLKVDAELSTGPARVVLYVEDNPANVVFMKDLLGTFDHLTLVTTTTAEDGVTAARRLLPDVILMDVNLPGMSGLDALKALRQFPETRAIPIIALTAAASGRDRERGEQAGFHRYLTKPVKVDELIAALEELFNGAKQAQ